MPLALHTRISDVSVSGGFGIHARSISAMAAVQFPARCTFRAEAQAVHGVLVQARYTGQWRRNASAATTAQRDAS